VRKGRKQELQREGEREKGRRKSDSHVIGSSLDLGIESVLVLVPEWGVANEENVEDDSAGPDVDGLAVGLLLQHLRGQVSWSSGEA
jgi:hypothetical protein